MSIILAFVVVVIVVACFREMFWPKDQRINSQKEAAKKELETRS